MTVFAGDTQWQYVLFFEQRVKAIHSKVPAVAREESDQPPEEPLLLTFEESIGSVNDQT